MRITSKMIIRNTSKRTLAEHEKDGPRIVIIDVKSALAWPASRP